MAGSTPKSLSRILVMGDTLVFRLSQKVLGVAVGAVVAGSGLTGSQAQAIVVTVNSQAWEVTTFTGTYNDNVSKFSATDMPWWDNSTLAGQFAVAVGNQFGTPNSGANQFADLLLPPYFAFSLTSFWVGLPQYFLVVNIFVNPSNPIFLLVVLASWHIHACGMPRPLVPTPRLP